MLDMRGVIIMAEPWVQRPLTTEERESMRKITERGYTVIVETNQGNTRIKVQKPEKPSKRR